MKTFFIDGIPHQYFDYVHGCWSSFDQSITVDRAEILFVGLTPFKWSPYYKRLKYIVSNCTNVDHIDPGPCKVISIGGHEFLENIPSTAEHTMMLMLMCARGMYHPVNLWTRNRPMGINLDGLTLGLVGYGRIGNQVSTMAFGLGMASVYHDPNVDGSKDLDQLLQNCDVISVHAKVHKSDPPIIGKEQIDMMKPGAIFINTSRGSAVDEEYLMENASKFRAIGLDVLVGEPEPYNFNFWRKVPNAIITPHIAGRTLQSLKLTSEYCYRLLSEEIDGNKTGKQKDSCKKN